MIFIWILLGIGIYYLIIEKNGKNLIDTKKDDAKEALDLRYVNGEIDDETYEKMKKLIK